MKQTAVEWFAEKVGHNSLISLVEYNTKAGAVSIALANC